MRSFANLPLPNQEKIDDLKPLTAAERAAMEVSGSLFRFCTFHCLISRSRIESRSSLPCYIFVWFIVAYAIETLRELFFADCEGAMGVVIVSLEMRHWQSCV